MESKEEKDDAMDKLEKVGGHESKQQGCTRASVGTVLYSPSSRA